MTQRRTLAVQKADFLQKKYATSDPFAIAEALGIAVRYVDSFKQLKGMYTVIARNRFIFLNANNSEEMNRIVCAHELGHDQLHRDVAKTAPLQEFTLWDLSGVREYEANLFAAQLLLSDEDVLSCITLGKTCAEIASITETDPNLVALKVECLKEKGYCFHEQIYENRFLK
jgi:Zn-dependent peptidase ImmA (M78 family)